MPIIYFGSKIFEPNEYKFILWIIIQNGFYFIYSIIGHYKFGQTFGKRLTFVKVVQNENETKLLSLTQAIKRDSIAILFVLLEIGVIAFGLADTDYGEIILEFSTSIWLIAELLTMLFNNKRRSVHDFIANSVCISIRKW